MNLKNQNLKFYTIVTIAIISWAFAFPFIKIGLEQLSFINLTLTRLFIVCLIFITIILIKPRWFSKLHKKDVLPIFILGFFGVSIYHLGLNYGETALSAGAASLIIATIPVFMVVFASIFLKERLPSIKICGIIIALFGVIIISILGKKDVSFEISYLSAVFAVLISAIVGALYTIAAKKLLSRYNALSLTVYAILLGSIGLIPLSLPVFNDSFVSEVTNLDNTGWFAILFLAFFSTVIGYTIWFYALERKTASELGVYLYAIPVLATLISYVLFKDQITYFYFIGGAFVIIGLILVNKKLH